jgi:hypothetical protein
MTQVRHTTAGYNVGTSATQTVGFHGATPVAQRAGAAQAAVSSTAVPNVGGTYSQAEVNAIVARTTANTVLLNEIRAALVEKGIIKGAA